MLRLALATLSFALITSLLPAQTPDPTDGGQGPALPPILGEVHGDNYYSPTGAFRIKIPVLPELNGQVTDSANMVTFQDPFTTYISIVTIPEDTTEKWHIETDGLKDYLSKFFMNFVYRDFISSNRNTHLEQTGLFSPNVQGGAFFAYLTLPGGSMFGNDLRITTLAVPPVAKRGNMIFVHDGWIYVISTELAERVEEGSLYKKTEAEQDQILKERLIDIASSIHFLKKATP